MKKWLYLTEIIIAIVWVTAVQGTTIFIDPAQQRISSIGEELILSIGIEDAVDLYAYQLTLVFDPAAIEFNGIEEGFLMKADNAVTWPVIVSGDDDSDIATFDGIDSDTVEAINQTGIINAINTRLGSNMGISGTGNIVNISFKAKNEIGSLLKLQNVVLVDSNDAQRIPVDIKNGEIIYSPNIPPVAMAGEDKTVYAGQEIFFDASLSSDEDGQIVSYLWNFGDGSIGEGVSMSHIYGNPGSYDVILTVTDDNGDQGVDSLSVTVMDKLPSVIREHSIGSPMLTLQADYQETSGQVYIDIWRGEMEIEAGHFLEYQLSMFSGNPTFQGTVELHTTDGGSLSLSKAVDQNGIISSPDADLSDYARDQWYHRKISLDALTGKTLEGITIATSSQDSLGGIFRLYVDNIQITDGEYIIDAIYIDNSFVPVTGTNESTETTFVEAIGVTDYHVSILGATSVNPQQKLLVTWGKIKTFD